MKVSVLLKSISKYRSSSNFSSGIGILLKQQRPPCCRCSSCDLFLSRCVLQIVLCSRPSLLHPLHHSVTMVLDEERECPVCFAEYSRSERVPRVLHCGHTCCSACVERMSSLSSTICAVRCPLCRWISCAPTCLPLPGALLVNTDIWDQIAAREEEKCETEEEELTKETL